MITAIVAAGGSGQRMGLATPKPFIKIANKALLFHTLDIFEKSKAIDSVVLVVAKGLLKRTKNLIKQRRYRKPIVTVAGGSTRARSVYNGLCVVDDSSIVLIHDVARPFLTQNLLKKCVILARNNVNCIAAVPVKATIKKVKLKNKNIISTPERKELWEAQTPQAFRKKTLLRAYLKLGKKAWKLKDDASLAEACGIKVRVVLGDYSNIKITTREDLKIAKAILECK